MHIIKKTGKILLYIVSGILVLLLIIGLLIDPIARRMLEKQANTAAEGQYTLQLDEVDISLLGGNFRLKGISLDTDTTIAGDAPAVFAEINEVAAEGVSWMTYLLTSKLLMDRIYLDNVELGVLASSVENDTDESDTTQTPFRLEQLNIYQDIKDQVELIHLKDLGLNRISFEIINVSTQDTLQFQADKLDLHSDNILIDANKIFTDSRAFYATRIDLNGSNLQVNRKGSTKFLAQADILKLDTREDKMGIQAQTVNFFQKGKSDADTVLFAALQEFELSALDMKKVQEENTGHLQKIAVRDLELINNMTTQADTTASKDTAQSVNVAKISFGENLPAVMDRLELEELDIQDVHYRQGSMIQLQGAGLHARQIVLDEQAAFAENRFLHASSMESSFDLLALSMGDAQLHFTLSDFEMNMKEGIGSLGFSQLQAHTEVKKKDATWYEAEIGPLSMISLNTRNMPERQLSIDSIAIQNPQLMLHIPQRSAQTTGRQPANPTLSLYPAIKDMLDSLNLRKLAIIGGDISVTGLGSDYHGVHLPAVYLQLRDVAIAEGTAFAGKRVLHTEDIALRMEDIQYLMPDNVYTVQLDLFRLSTYEQFIQAKNFQYGYNDHYEQLLNSSKTNTIYQLENKDFSITGLNYQQLIQQKGFFARTIQSQGLDFYLYTDHNKPKEEQEEQTQEMPQKMLKQMEKPFYLGKLAIEGAHVTYEELVDGADTSGMVEITDMAFLADNITNVQSILQEDPEIPLQIKGNFMGSGAFESEMVVHMLSDSNLVTFSGKLDTMDITKMNQLTQYISPLAFSSGVVHEISWDIEADEAKAAGSLAMSYDNLDIQISDSTSPDTTGILKNVGSFLANSLLLESDVAPKSSEEPERAKFAEARQEEGFPNYVVQAMVSGFLELMVTIF